MIMITVETLNHTNIKFKLISNGGINDSLIFYYHLIKTQYYFIYKVDSEKYYEKLVKFY